MAATTPVSASLDLVQRLCAALRHHHAEHLLPAVLTALGPRLEPTPRTVTGDERRHVDLTAVVGLAGLLAGDRPELIGPILLAVAPWLPVTPQIEPAPVQVVMAVDGLTSRHVEVLDLASHGHSNGEIGKKLRLRPNTVKAHLSHAYAALGVRDRAHAVRRCFEIGVLTLSD